MTSESDQIGPWEIKGIKFLTMKHNSTQFKELGSEVSVPSTRLQAIHQK